MTSHLIVFKWHVNVLHGHLREHCWKYNSIPDLTAKTCLAGSRKQLTCFCGWIFPAAQFLHPDFKLYVLHVFFNHLDESNKTVKSVMQFEEVYKTGLDNFFWVSFSKIVSFFIQAPNWMFYMVVSMKWTLVESIIHFDKIMKTNLVGLGN